MTCCKDFEKSNIVGPCTTAEGIYMFEEGSDASKERINFCPFCGAKLE